MNKFFNRLGFLLKKIISSRYFWLIVIGIILEISIALLLNDRKEFVQAGPVAALVVITVFYAIETHNIVAEGRIKRIADFKEKRINEFYLPFIKHLSKLQETSLSSDRRDDLMYGTRYFLLQKAYLAPKETIRKIRELLPFLEVADLDKDEDTAKDYYEAEKAVKEIIRNELHFVTEELRKIYEFSEGKNERTSERKKSKA